MYIWEADQGASPGQAEGVEGLPWIPRRPSLDPRFFGVFSGSPSTLGSSPDPRLFVGPCRPSWDSRPEKTPSGDPRSLPALPSFPCRATGCSMEAEEGTCSGVESADEHVSDEDDTASSAICGAASSSAGARKRKRDNRGGEGDGRKRGEASDPVRIWTSLMAGVRG